MTNHNRQDILPSSEDYTYWSPSGSQYCNPQEVENWSQQIPFPENTLPSPPLTDCSSTDCPDMSKTMTQTSRPEDRSAGPMTGNGHFYPANSVGWCTQGAPVTADGISALNTSLLSAPPRSVDLGSSPVLSHESQSLDTLNTLSEPDCQLPEGLDLSFAMDPWTSGPSVYNGSNVPAHLSNFGFTSVHGQGHYAYGCSMPATTTAYPATDGSTFTPQAEMTYPSRTGPSHGHQHLERPQMPASQGSQFTVSSVSSTSGHSDLSSSQSSGPTAGPSEYPNNGFSGSVQSGDTFPFTMVPYAQAGFGPSVPSFVLDPTDEDFSNYIHFEQDDLSQSAAALSYAPAYGYPPTLPSSGPEDVKPVVPVPQQDLKSSHGSGSTSAMASDSEEGRHRNHPLYSKGPHSDGMYHCPYKSTDPNCPHKPTKLKCNYDKYIDSHLKPFRCKVEACAKQEFSSTACLLRHEREAHGMHGHGDRPHLCMYEGCERGVPGYGFPRRYNLYDHMKRVHDHKEDLADTRSSGVDGSKKAGSRKRKASSPVQEPVAQRQKTLPLAPQANQAIYYPTAGYLPQAMYDVEPLSRNQVISQWAQNGQYFAGQGNEGLCSYPAHARRR